MKSLALILIIAGAIVGAIGLGGWMLDADEPAPIVAGETEQEPTAGELDWNPWKSSNPDPNPNRKMKRMCQNCNLTPRQHKRLDQLPEDFRIVGWDPAFSCDGIAAGPLIEDPLGKGITRLSPRGKLLNMPSADAVERVWARRERQGLR